MKVLKAILYVIIGIVALFLIIALFLPDHVRVERSIVIEKPASTVYNLIIDFNYYKKWNPWSQMDPQAKGKLEGKAGVPGQKWTWDGEIVGKGFLMLKETVPNKMVKSELKFLEPFEAKSMDLWTFEPVSGGTKVVWANESDVEYPVGRYFALFYDGMMGPDFEKGLENLKNLAESLEETPNETEQIDAKEMKMQMNSGMKNMKSESESAKKTMPMKKNPSNLMREKKGN